MPSILIVEADLFISYLTGDPLEPRFRRVVEAGHEGKVRLLASSEVYDDVISALRGQNVPLAKVREFVRDMKTIPHQALPVTPETAALAVQLYLKHGGGSRLHYFDSFHVATSQLEKLTLLTSDGYILDHADQLNIKTLNAGTM